MAVMLRVALRGMLGRKLRTVLTALAIVLGVAMVTGTFILTDSINQAFSGIFSTVYSGTDATITGKSAFDLSGNNGTIAPPFRQSLLGEVRRLPDVQDAVGGVAGDAQLIGKNGKAIVFGGAPNLGFSVDPTRPALNSLTLVQGSWPHAGQVVIDQSTASKKDLNVGQPVGIQAEGPVKQFGISGLVHFGGASSLGGATLAGFDLPTAQRLFNKEGKLDQIRAKAIKGVSPQQLAQQIQPILPDGTQVRTAAAQAKKDSQNATAFISFLQDFLLAFGGIALFVGAFVIANSLSITIAQRMREFATLRTIGASRRQVLWSVIVEAFVTGLLASIVGVLAGIGLANGLFKLFDAVGFTLPNNGLVLQTRTVVIGLLAGIIVTVVASVRPAMRATRVPPIAAVREGAILPVGRFHRYRPIAASVTTIVGFAALIFGLFGPGLGTDGDPPLDGPGRPADLQRGLAALVQARAAACRRARVARTALRRRRGRARARQLEPQPRAHSFDGVGTDDRPGTGDARCRARGRDHEELPRCRQRLVERRLRDHGAEQLLADRRLGCERGDEGARCDSRRERPRGRRQGLRQRRHSHRREPGRRPRLQRQMGRGSQNVFRELGANGVFIDTSAAKNPTLSIGSPVVVETPRGRQLHMVVKGIFDQPAGGSPFGSVTMSQATFDRNYDSPRNLYSFVRMRGGETAANQARLDAALKASRTRRCRRRRSSSTIRSPGSTRC